jgi:hypothetical protein
MRTEFTVTGNALQFLGHDLSVKAQRCTAIALTKTASAAKAAIVADLPRIFDRPVAFTMNALVVRAARYERGSMTARVDFKDWQTKYMRNIIDGGADMAAARHLKRFELALQAVNAMPRGWVCVPAKGFPVDGYGNMGRGTLMKIVSQIGTELLSGYQNRTHDPKAMARNKKRNGTFFALQPGNKQGMPAGVYQRVRTGFGWGTRLVLAYVKSAKYTQRIKLKDYAQAAYQQHFQTEFNKAMNT